MSLALAIAVLATGASCFDAVARLLAQEPPGDGGQAPPAEGGEPPPAVGAEDGPPEDPAAAPSQPKAPAEPVPQFKDEAGKTRFDAAKALFENGEFIKAEKEFKALGSSVASKADKEILTRWQSGARVSQAFPQVKALADKKQFNGAQDLLARLYPQAQGTPALKSWAALNEEVEKLLLQKIETFDFVTGNFSKEQGETFVADAKKVFKGPRCLRWQNTADRKQPGNLNFKNVPRDWSNFSAVEFWVHTNSTVATEVFIFTDAVAKPGVKTTGLPPRNLKPGEELRTLFMAPLAIKSTGGRWQRVRIPLNTFKPQGDASLTAVKRMLLQIRPGSVYDILVDEISLVRRDPTPDKKGAAPPRR